MTRRLFVKITRENLPQVKDRYPFIYLEYGRMEIDDSSIKWIDSECNIVRIPCATINMILLGPGTSITHEAVKVCAASNCIVAWVGEDSMLFYALGQSPNADTRNLKKQMLLASDPHLAEQTARKLFAKRFPEADLLGKNLKEMMGMEGYRVRQVYESLAEKYGVGWKGRSYQPGKFELGDTTNKYLTAANAALYGILSSVVHSMGYSPHIGFIHSGSPLPLVYDLADLYKEYHSIDLAFFLTVETAGVYTKERISEEFRKRIVERDLLSKITLDIGDIFKG